MRASCFVIACIAAGCSSSDGKDCALGDLDATPELQLFHETGDGAIGPSDSITLEQPPQGGWVFYVAPHIRNMDGCGLQLETSLVDKVNNTIVVFESRPIVLADDGTGWGVPMDVSGDGLVAACPQAMLARDLYDQTYSLHVVATDDKGRAAEQTLDVVPKCSDPFCTCQCSHTYKLGDDCSGSM